MARGTTKRPAPVSGPGAQSQRTDGGPGSKSQPLRTAVGQPYGAAKASEDQQRAAPLATGDSSPSSPGGGGAPQALPSAEGVFTTPTERPSSPLNSGLAQPGQESPLDGATLLQILFEKYPSQYLARLMQNDQPRTL